MKYAHKQCIKAEKVSLEQTLISEALCQNLKDKQIIANVLTHKMAEKDINIKGYHHIFDSQRFKNALGETMVDLYTFSNSRVTKSVKIAVDQYYVHMLDNLSHQSKEFKKELVEHFGAFTGNNNEPYTTANTVSSHNQDHLKCVQKLIQDLQPLSDAVNNYIRDTYPVLYIKMKKLNLGPNVPKSFGAFPTVAVNFNIISQFHRDLKDHRDSLCVVCPLGTFEGGQLVFPELKLIIHAREGQAIAFRSNILVHGNLPVIAGIHHSIVFFIHATSIKQNRKFGNLFHNTYQNNLYSEIDVSMNYNSKKLEASKKHTMQNKKKSKSSKSSLQLPKIKNSRRSFLGKYNCYIRNYNYFSNRYLYILTYLRS